eukprot:5274409-Pyramimonas_sp.AAC.1
MAKAWSTCAKCGTYEYNERIVANSGKCTKCHCPVKLYKPKKGPASSSTQPSLQNVKGSVGSQVAATTSTIQALSAAMARVTDPVSRKVLAEQIEFAKRGAQAAEQPLTVSPSEAVRRAEG